MTNSTNEIHIMGWISLIFPVNTFRMTHEIIPNIIPVAMEFEKGIMIIAKNPPTLSAISPSNFILVIFFIMRSPTKTSAGVVAKEGIARNMG